MIIHADKPKAIVMYPPRERERKKSEQDDNKDLGRNESIAEYLESKFGKNMWGDKKGRKVVSSHIQVLRGHFDLPKAEKEMNPPPPNPFADGKNDSSCGPNEAPTNPNSSNLFPQEGQEGD